jgi:predicted LPLAT superfamily acyltransferase
MTKSSITKPSMTKQWQAEREHGSPFLISLLTWVALHLGRRVIHIWLYVIVFYYFLVAGKARRASRHFLTLALQRSPRWWEIYRHLLSFAVVAIDRIYFLSGREASFNVQVHGNDIFSRYQQRGCFLVTAHMGSFDAMRVMGMGARTKALPISILLDLQHNANAMRLIQALDPELAANVIDARTPGPELVLKLSEAIAHGHLVGIMADRCAQGERRTSLDFLGQPAEFPQGVWQLASLLQAPVIACFGIYKGGNKYDLHFELISEQLGTSRKDRAAAIASAMSIYTERLEHFARSYPYNWFNFYDFWHNEPT